jgi:hypothetical protein
VTVLSRVAGLLLIAVVTAAATAWWLLGTGHDLRRDLEVGTVHTVTTTTATGHPACLDVPPSEPCLVVYDDDEPPVRFVNHDNTWVPAESTTTTTGAGR